MVKKKTRERDRVIHRTFEVSIFFKGVDGVLEIIGGILLLAVKPAAISGLVLFLTEHELSKHPRDIMARYLVHAAQNLSVSTKLFGSFYLLSHGLIKVVLVISLWKSRLWAYPAAIIFFIVFILYQLYRFSHSHSIWLICLSFFDALIIYLTWLEYRHIRGKSLSG